MRNKDRQINMHAYPRLIHPELYILHGGYKEFFENYKVSGDCRSRDQIGANGIEIVTSISK